MSYVPLKPSLLGIKGNSISLNLWNFKGKLLLQISTAPVQIKFQVYLAKKKNELRLCLPDSPFHS